LYSSYFSNISLFVSLEISYREYLIEPHSWACTCMAYFYHGRLCTHALAARRICGEEDVIETEDDQASHSSDPFFFNEAACTDNTQSDLCQHKSDSENELGYLDCTSQSYLNRRTSGGRKPNTPKAPRNRRGKRNPYEAPTRKKPPSARKTIQEKLKVSMTELKKKRASETLKKKQREENREKNESKRLNRKRKRNDESEDENEDENEDESRPARQRNTLSTVSRYQRRSDVGPKHPKRQPIPNPRYL